ncbi:efflux RND transporter periplasmic adaptor subunit [Arhodomonas sp. SL1]|uniref:efflux RND transporter periplasmic adaptor subunit n=1 Tax=Arhodomonas sp. SL1 TaxID=3425691 RepID=UPI003F882C0B
MDTSGFRRLLRLGWVVAGLAVGAALLALAVIRGEQPERTEAGIEAPALRFIEAQSLPLQIEARGRGVSRPAERWRATASVAGRVVERHPELESGSILTEGTLLLRLDPTRYRLAEAEAQADLARLAAELRQLEREETNTRELVALERERLALAEKELERIERLAERGSISRSQRDEQRRATIAQRQSVTSLENELALIPARRNRLEAEQERAEARREQAREDLEDTRFRAPYDLRMSEVQVELHDRVRAGELLFEADSVAATEVEAHIPLPMLRRLVGAVITPVSPPAPTDILERLDLGRVTAELTLVAAEDVHWTGRVTRIASGPDPTTRAMRVVVTVDDPYREASPPERPALQPGMYVQARLRTPSPEPRLIVPAGAVHDGEVYLVTEDQRLQRRPVRVAFQQNDLAIISDGLEAGERVIIDDPVPAVDGMAVRPRRDQEAETALRERAAGSQR